MSEKFSCHTFLLSNNLGFSTKFRSRTTERIEEHRRLLSQNALVFFLSLITEIELTVGTSVGLQSESDPPAEIPVQGEEAEESSHRRLLQLVLNHTVSVTVPWKSLGTHRCGGNIDQQLLINDPVFHRVNTPTICGTVCGGTSSRTRTAPTPAA